MAHRLVAMLRTGRRPGERTGRMRKGWDRMTEESVQGGGEGGHRAAGPGTVPLLS